MYTFRGWVVAVSLSLQADELSELFEASETPSVRTKLGEVKKG